MFELKDSTVDGIIFAMEDQDGTWLVDLETGELYDVDEDGYEDEEDDEGGSGSVGDDREDLDFEDETRFVAPPEWSSREGFKLMEDFLGMVRQPSARQELGAALARGKGVFKAFKEVLAAHPEIEKAFRDHKTRAMRAAIRAWYNGLREIRGLERLGPEPEDTTDLVESDLGIRLGDRVAAGDRVLALVADAEAEALELLPEALAAREAELLTAALAAGDAVFAWADDGEGGAVAGAAALRERAAGRSFARVVFIYVEPTFRRAGLGRALLAALAKNFRAEGTDLLVFDSAFAPADFGRALESTGFRPFGVRSLSRG